MDVSWNLITPLFPHINYIVALLLLLLLEQFSYLNKKRFLPGPSLVLPFIGNAISLVADPTKFWNRHCALAKSTNLGISANYIIGRYILYIYSSDLSHKIFANVHPDAFQLIGHPFGRKLFGDHNLIYMFGQEHKDLRRQFAPNFTPKALQIYTDIQHRIILKHLQSWCRQAAAVQRKSIPLRILCHDMNLETSQTVFVGPYLDEKTQKRFNVDYNTFNVGLMKLPIDLPGFAFRDARLAVQRLVETLGGCAAASEKRMKAGDEPSCLIDFWMQENLRLMTEKPFQYSHRETGAHLFDFLFAAQDASTSSLVWAVTMLESHPNVVERVREEVAKHWSGSLLTGKQLGEMKYTEAVAREVVRIRAPATMVPHVTRSDFQLTDNYVIPKGTIVFPSVFDSSFQGFTEPEKFDPERFLEDRQEDRVHKKNYLVFGAGSHQCVGQSYAINHLKLFVATFAYLVDFKRDRTDGCDDIAYFPTIVPKDNCRVFLSQRYSQFPQL